MARSRKPMIASSILRACRGANGLQTASSDATQILRRAPGASDKPQTHSFGPLLTLGYVNGDALPFRQRHDAGTLQR
jgi:hypothetical protein